MPRAWVPLALGAALCLGAYLGRGLGTGTTAWEFAEPRFLPSGQVLRSVLDRIDRMYVAPVDRNRLTDIANDAILDELDPHSDWFSAEELAAMAEPMEGNFEGIGVEFLLQEDTIMVVTPIVGGPSEAAGIRSGDRIVSVDDSVIAGTGLSNSKVMRLLKGPSGRPRPSPTRRVRHRPHRCDPAAWAHPHPQRGGGRAHAGWHGLHQGHPVRPQHPRGIRRRPVQPPRGGSRAVRARPAGQWGRIPACGGAHGGTVPRRRGPRGLHRRGRPAPPRIRDGTSRAPPGPSARGDGRRGQCLSQ